MKETYPISPVTHSEAGEAIPPDLYPHAAVIGNIAVESSDLPAPVGLHEKSMIRDSTEAIEEIEPAMNSLIEKLAPGIREGRWTSVLGDDVGGRLPATMVGSVMKDLAREHPGSINPQRLFIAAGRDQDKRTDSIDDYIGAIKPQLGERVLLVSEYVETGKTIIEMALSLRRQGIACDIATAQLFEAEVHNSEDDSYSYKPLIADRIEELSPEDRELLADVEIISGEMTDHAPALYRAKYVGGISKTDTSPTTIRKPSGNIEELERTEWDSVYVPGVVRNAREMTRDISDRLYKEHFTN